MQDEDVFYSEDGQIIESFDDIDTTNSSVTNTGLGTRSLFVVGDDAQSIYGFRGSDISIILNFEKEYLSTKQIILNQNYRSTQPILDLAEKVLSHNPNQKKKGLYTDNSDKTKVYYYLARSERDEADFIAKKLYELYGKNTEGKLSNKTTATQIDTEKEALKSEFSPAKLSALLE